ncbi:DUF779 domain-containing protein [Flavobacterium branchiophilum]|nr:DUF779 domain-containing protein [Flavobacterium branchiophilum]TQM39570.1 hypothetical protein BC670_0370 [Flavobacterium branchiophilum]GEM56066.1 hypothetical protein FB1_22870 [Flavobacterium branchiophilum NBRC 15030 = ATCC 35035]
MMTNRVHVTQKAIDLIARLKDTYGPLMFHQSGGCCDGSQPMCFEKGDFKLGQNDVCLGVIEDCEFWMSKDQFEYWQYTQLTIDVVAGRGSSFSLEIPLGFRFITQSRMFTASELKALNPLQYVVD